MRQIRQALQHSNLTTPLRHLLINCMMPYKLSCAITLHPLQIHQPRIPYCIITRDLHDVVPRRVEIVPNIFGEGALFMRPRLVPRAAAGISDFAGTLGPGFKHGEGVGQGLGDDEAGVLCEFSFGILRGVFVPVVGEADVEGHCDGGLGRHAPAVEEPFDGYFEVLDCGVAVDEDDEAVGVEELKDGVRLDPCSVETFHFVCVEEAVVVAVYLGWWSSGIFCCSSMRIRTVKVVVHETRTDHTIVSLLTHSFPVQAVIAPYLIRAIRHSSVDVHDEDIFPEWLVPPRRISIFLGLEPFPICVCVGSRSDWMKYRFV